MERDSSDFDFPCSPTWRGYYNERYGFAGIDYAPGSSRANNRSAGPDQALAARVDALEAATNQLFALSAMRSLEVTELAQRRHKPRY